MEPRYVTPKDGVGFAIIALGVLALLLPWSSSTVGAAVKADPYAVLIGTIYVLGLMVVFAGIAVLRLKKSDE